MMKWVLPAVLGLALAAQPVVAQDEGGGGGGGFGGGGGGFGGGGGSGLPAGMNAPLTIAQQFASKLKLEKTQSPDVDQVLSAAAAEAAPVSQQMLQLRQRMVNAARTNRPEELKAAQDEYAAAAAKAAAIEAAAFGKVYAMLKPNQQKDAPQAFALLAGLFTNATAPAGGARGGRAQGQGGGR